MPQQLLLTTADGTSQVWGAYGGLPACQAVLPTSSDLTGIFTATATATSSFVTESGRAPARGFIGALVAHCRLRLVDPAAVGGTVDLLVLQNAVEHVVATIVPTTSWITTEVRIRADWTSGIRFTGIDLNTLEVGVRLTGVPTLGGIEVSQLWLSVETIDSERYYDPFCGGLPTAVVGPLAWSTSGAAPVALTADPYLRLTDASAVTNRQFQYSDDVPKRLRSEYSVEFETRIVLKTAPPVDSCFYYIGGYDDLIKNVDVSLFKVGAVYYVCLSGDPLDHNVFSTFLATAALPGDIVNQSIHFRIVVDRGDDPTNLGQVSVYVNYATTPLVQAPYVYFPNGGPFWYFFGTPTFGQCVMDIDYVGLKTYKRVGVKFAAWDELDLDVNYILPDNTDADRCPLVTLPPSNLVAGQSNYACKLVVGNKFEYCRLSQWWYDRFGAPTSYELAVDYKTSIAIGNALKVSIQRVPDLFYWNNGTSAWQAAASSVLLPSSNVRVRTVACTAISNSFSTLAFNPVVDNVVRAVAIQADGKVLLGGDFHNIDGVARNHIARLNTDGTLDLTFNPNADGAVHALVVQPDTNILVGGDFHNMGVTARNHIARLDSSGVVEVGFDPNADNSVRCFAIQADNKIVVGGGFSSIGGLLRHKIARLASTGAIDAGFDPDADDYVYALAIQVADSKIIMGGDFWTVGGVARHNVARLETTGALDMGFDPAADSGITAIALQADAKILIGGDFTTIGAPPVARNYIARLETTGALDAGFNPNANSYVRTILVQPDAKIVVGGNFTTIAATARNYIARLESTGAIDVGFNPIADNLVRTAALQVDTKIVVGGDFHVAGGNIRNHIARLLTTGALDPGVAVGAPTALRFTVEANSAAPVAAYTAWIYAALLHEL